jgi:hypothetical protein
MSQSGGRMSNTARKQSRGRESGAESNKRLSRRQNQRNVVHSAARRQSMLCRSTTYRAHQDPASHETPGMARHPRTWTRYSACRCRGSRGRHSVGRSRPQSAIHYAIVAKGKLAHSDPGSRLGAGPPAQPHQEHPGSARADRVRTGCSLGGKVRSAIKNIRRASGNFARDWWTCDARRALGLRGPGVAAPHEVTVGTDTTNLDRKIDAGARESCSQLKSKRKRRNGPIGNWKGQSMNDQLAGPGRPSMLMLLTET